MALSDLIELAKKAQSVKELVALARKDKIEISEEDARIYFERWHSSYELSDDELDMVGGGAEERPAVKTVCEFCGSDNLGTYLSGGGFYCYGCNRRCMGKKAQ